VASESRTVTRTVGGALVIPRPPERIREANHPGPDLRHGRNRPEAVRRVVAPVREIR
jgi:hypothetical protein